MTSYSYSTHLPLERGVRVSRTLTTCIDSCDVPSIGASYTHITSLKGVIGPHTKKIVMYHSMLTDLSGFEDAEKIDIVYIAFNRIKHFREKDRSVKIGVLDLAGNPLEELAQCPQCDELIVSATCIKDLQGAPEGIKILRCGHSTFLESLKGCPESVILIECSCAPNLIIDGDDLPEGLEELIT